MLGLGAWDVVLIIGVVVGVPAVFMFAQLIYFSMVLAWGDQKTQGLSYYGLPLVERDRFKRILRRHSIALYPILRVLGKTSKFTFDSASFVEQGVHGPKGSCNVQSFRSAIDYQPRPEDVFVATQMKCGTTWMQNLVYEVVHRGAGDLVDKGGAMYAVSPWIEGVKSVAMADSIQLGRERPTRIIKTHLPTQVCPYDAAAKYVYVVRHPVSCFASCVDFVATNIGTFAPPLNLVEEWFCSERMWWGSWPGHVKGWWEWSQQRPNVLFVWFEEMKRDLPAVVERVAAFLEMQPLTDAELGSVVHKSGFAYMKEHAAAFEMNPPHLLQADADLFISGKADRHKDVPEDVRDRIRAWCAAELIGSDFPLDLHYADIAAARSAGQTGA